MIHIYRTKYSGEYYAIDTLYGPHCVIWGATGNHSDGYKKSLQEVREMVDQYIRDQRPTYIETIYISGGID